MKMSNTDIMIIGRSICAWYGYFDKFQIFTNKPWYVITIADQIGSVKEHRLRVIE